MADINENLSDQPQQGPGGPSPAPAAELEPSKDAKMWAMFCHLSALAGFVFPAFGNIIAPLILWQIKKELPFVDDQGKEALNFQISITIYSLATIPLWCILIGPFVFGAICLFAIVMLIIAAINANNGVRYRYPLCLRLIK